MKRLIPYLPLLFLLSGCAWAESMGLWDSATGTPTAAGVGLNETVRQLTGLDYLKVFGMVRTYDALGTKRGLQNMATLLNPGAEWPATRQSFWALLLGWHTPEEAKGAATP